MLTTLQKHQALEIVRDAFLEMQFEDKKQQHLFALIHRHLYSLIKILDKQMIKEFARENNVSLVS